MPISTRILISKVSREDTAMKPMPETIACTRSTAPRLLIRPAMMNSVVVMNRRPSGLPGYAAISMYST